MSLKYLAEGQTDPQEPALLLTSVTIQLKGYSDIRCKGRFHFDTSEQVVCQTINFNAQPGIKGIEMPLDNTPVLVSSDFKLGDMTPYGSGLVPDSPHI